jgi:hypothetical protein
MVWKNDMVFMRTMGYPSDTHSHCVVYTHGPAMRGLHAWSGKNNGVFMHAMGYASDTHSRCMHCMRGVLISAVAICITSHRLVQLNTFYLASLPCRR